MIQIPCIMNSDGRLEKNSSFFVMQLTWSYWMLQKFPTYTFIQSYTFISFPEKFSPIVLFSPIHLLFVMEFSHLNFYSELLSIQNSRIMKVQSWFIRWYVDTMIQNSNYQAENDQNSSLCTPLVPNKERQCSLDKRQRFCCDDHADCITSYSLNNISIQKMYYCLAYFQCNLSYRF